jgi:TonB family protein
MSKKVFFITLITAIAFTLSASAQKTDTAIYYIKSIMGIERPVTAKDSPDYYRMITPSTDDPKEMNMYQVEDYYMNMKPKMIGKTRNNGPMLQLEGSAIEFFPNGHRKAIRNYVNGRLSGDVTEYFPNGHVYISGVYGKYNVIIINESRDSTGRILVKDDSGYYVKYDREFKNVIEAGNIINGKYDGEVHGQFNDSVNYMCIYEKGQLKRGTSYSKSGKKYQFSKAEIEPQFNGGIDAFYHFLINNIHYPKVAKDNNVQGKVFITFVVERDGSLTDIKILRGIGSGCDEEAMRVLKLSPKWVSGLQYGVPVRVQYTMPLSFTLSVKN